MRNVLLVIILMAANLGTGFAQKRFKVQKVHKVHKPKGIAVAFFDQQRLFGEVDGQATFDDFRFFFEMVHDIVKRDFPNVELRILTRGEYFRLPDDTGLNVANMKPTLGYVLWAQGKRRVLTGVQTDMDFACAASMFFHQPSPVCVK